MIVSIFGMTSDSTFRSEEPNKTKPPLQVLPVVEGNSEKIRFRIKHVIWEYIGLNIKLSIRISHHIFLISYRRVGWSLNMYILFGPRWYGYVVEMLKWSLSDRAKKRPLHWGSIVQLIVQMHRRYVTVKEAYYFSFKIFVPPDFFLSFDLSELSDWSEELGEKLKLDQVIHL